MYWDSVKNIKKGMLLVIFNVSVLKIDFTAKVFLMVTFHILGVS